MNDLLAWGHARVIENLLEQRPDCGRSLSDKFANERVIERALLKQAKKIKIEQRRQKQSAETIAHLKAKYENPIFGRMDVWELIEKMAYCIDTTDSRLGCASQLTHVQQAIAAMESEGVTDTYSSSPSYMILERYFC